MDTQVTGKIPLSHDRTRHPGVPLVYPLAREVGRQDSFICLAEEELFLNTLVSGGKGKGKTAGMMRPFLRFAMCHPQRAGALVFDVKGDLTPYIVQLARSVGREEDVAVIDPRGNFLIQLFPGSLTAETLASIVLSAIGTISGGHSSHEAFWLHSAEELVKFSILALRMAEGDLCFPVTPTAILSVIAVEHKLGHVLDRVNLRDKQGEFTSEEGQYYVEYLNNFYHQHTDLDIRVKSSIEAELRRFLKDFSSYNFQRVFCPRPLDSCVNIDDIIDDGKIVVLHMPKSLYADTSRFIGMLLKGHFYNSVLSRITVGSKHDRERPVFFVCDEYQNFATLGGSVGADEQFAALSRQARAGLFCATQELGSLYSVAGYLHEESVGNLLQNFQNHVLLRQDITPRLATLLRGKGLDDVACIPMLQPYEALVFRDAHTAARLGELGPYYADWDYVSKANARNVENMKRRKEGAFKASGLSREGEI